MAHPNDKSGISAGFVRDHVHDTISFLICRQPTAERPRYVIFEAHITPENLNDTSRETPVSLSNAQIDNLIADLQKHRKKSTKPEKQRSDR